MELQVIKMFRFDICLMTSGDVWRALWKLVINSFRRQLFLLVILDATHRVFILHKIGCGKISQQEYDYCWAEMSLRRHTMLQLSNGRGIDSLIRCSKVYWVRLSHVLLKLLGGKCRLFHLCTYLMSIKLEIINPGCILTLLRLFWDNIVVCFGRLLFVSEFRFGL